MVGLPGTGLGGVFYILLVLWMGVRECWLLLRTASHLSRWRKIASLGSLAASILAALWLEGWLLNWFLTSPSIAITVGDFGRGAMNAQIAVHSLTPALTIAPFVILIAMFAGVGATSHVLRYRKKMTFQQSPLLSNLDAPPSQ